MNRMHFTGVLALLCVALLTATLLTGCFGRGEETGDTTATTVSETTVTEPATTGTTARAYPFTGFINATTLNVRPTADTSGYSIGGLKFGDTVTVTGREGDWYCIAFGSGIGYVSAQYVQDTPPALTTTAAATTTVVPAVTTDTATTALAVP